MTRPDGKTVALDYGTESSRLEAITIAEGVYAYGHDTDTDPQAGKAAGQLATLDAPGGQMPAYGWDGELPISTGWSGPVAGSSMGSQLDPKTHGDSWAMRSRCRSRSS